MTTADVDNAVGDSGLFARDFCRALDLVLPVLRKLKEGRPWWLRMGMNTLIGALEGYRAETCGQA